MTDWTSPGLRLLTAAVLTVGALAGCEALERLDNIDIEIEANTVVAGGGLVESVLDLFPQLDSFTRFDLSQSSEFRNSKYGPDDVDSVYLTSLRIHVTDPDDQDFSFLRGMTITLEADGLPDKEVAWLDPIPEGTDTIDLELLNEDIQDYVMAKEGTLTVDVRDAKRPPDDTTLRFVAIFDVDIRIPL